MTDHCEKCWRVKSTSHLDVHWSKCRDIAGIGDEMDALLCEVAADAYRSGLREGVEIAKAHAEIERHAFRIVPTILWTDVDSEIARRIGDG